MKVARGRSWQPEIGMEHASRGRRSGNKGVGARWRGRFRIFSARHCSRTKVSHAENSGMTMLFFSWRLLRCRACVDHRSGHAAPCHHGSGWHEGGWFLFFSWGLLRCLFFSWGLLRCRRGILSHARERSFGAVTPLERRDPALRRGRRVLMRFLVLWGGVVAVCFEGLLRGHVLAGGPARHACRRGSGSTRGFDFFVLGILSHARARPSIPPVGF